MQAEHRALPEISALRLREKKRGVNAESRARTIPTGSIILEYSQILETTRLSQTVKFRVSREIYAPRESTI